MTYHPVLPGTTVPLTLALGTQVLLTSVARDNSPTQGRRRRRKSPASIPSTQQLPLPRLLDHMNAADGPSEVEEEEKDAKRQRSAPTTPRSTSSILPHEYDEVMGIAPVEPHESERFEEGNDSGFQDAEETATRETNTGEKAHT